MLPARPVTCPWPVTWGDVLSRPASTQPETNPHQPKRNNRHLHHQQGLDRGDPDAVFIFQIGSALTTASASSVVLLNGANSCNVYWQVGSSATLGTDTRFVGTIMAFTSITLDTGARIQGRALPRNGSVTLDSNVLSSESCEVGSTPAPTDGPGTPGPTDGPGTPGPTDGPGTPGPTDAPATPGPDDTPGTPVSIAPVVVPSGGTTSPGGSGSATTPGGGGTRTGAGKTSLAATGSSPWAPLALGGGVALVLGSGMVTAWMGRRYTRV
ncbi:MAG: ice-binding family protein [Pauljensenia sp.]